MLQQAFNPTLTDEIPVSMADYPPPIEAEANSGEVDCSAILAAIDRLEETILNSHRVPLTGKTIINEEELLEQLDAIRSNLPDTIIVAQEIVQYKKQIIGETQQQVQQILAEANQRAYQVANELGIIDRSEQEAKQIKQIAIAECEQLRQQTIVEVERIRTHNIQEMERMRQQVTIECQEILAGADEYADRILHNMEYQLTDVLQAIQSGRKRLNIESESVHNYQFTARELTNLDSTP
jgi:cell division septum initiation protein DivIVA